MATSFSTRFFTERIDRAALEAKNILTKDAEAEYKVALSKSATKWSNRIRSSGRGGRHNAQMSQINSSITQTRSGKFFMRVGWLGSPPEAEDGKTTWFVYQDKGYNAFGRGTPVPGLLLQIDARDDLKNELAKANDRLIERVESAFRK